MGLTTNPLLEPRLIGKSGVGDEEQMLVNIPSSIGPLKVEPIITVSSF